MLHLHAPQFSILRSSSVIVLLVLLSGWVIHLSVDSGQKVSARAEVLVSKLIPELRVIGVLQSAMNRHVIDLHVYYSTTIPMLSKNSVSIKEEFEGYLDQLKALGYNDEVRDSIHLSLDGFVHSVEAFDKEMQRGNEKSWDTLREHLSRAQIYANALDTQLVGWAKNIRSRAGSGGEQTLNEVARLSQLQLGFAVAVAVVALLVLLALYARMKDQAELHRRAYHDDLTNLPNRCSLDKDWYGHFSGEYDSYALSLISLDRYAMITGTYGHLVGDKVLGTVSEWLKDQLKLNSPGAQLYRFSSSTWVAVIPENSDLSVATRWARQVKSLSQTPVNVDQQTFNVTCSQGVSYYRLDGDSLVDLLRNADAAHREAAISGGNDFRTYDESMNRRMEERLAIESGLHKAISESEFELYFQPKVNAEGEIVAAEALIRWNKEGEMVLPGVFIPIAEQSALIVPIGDWVLKEACEQWVSWRSKQLRPIPIAVNVSAQQFQDPNFSQQVARVLRVTGMPAEFLELEITEEAAAENPKLIVSTMHALKKEGVHLAIDDFGTGYSSLSYLQQMPLDILKIDQSFVSQMLKSEGDMTIVRTVMSLAHDLDLKVVAEGVETTEQQQALVNLHCDLLQGYLFDRPMPVEEYEKRLQ